MIQETTDEVEKLEEELEYIDDTNIIPPDDVVAYNELRSCADIYRMYEKKQLKIDPEFQRDIVWSLKGQSLFIDSLSKQFPIPSMCISLDNKTEKRLVIDGLQRIQSIINFLGYDENTKERDWRLSSAKGIDLMIAGKKVSEIKKNNLEIYERIENLTIPITLIRCDYSKKDHMSYLFTIFHRLNSGGTKLNNQEIRNCIYSGSFNDFLKNECDKYENWRKLVDANDVKLHRFRYVEQILRFFALLYKQDKYNGGLTQFLNDYMQENKDLKPQTLGQMKNIFEKTVDLAYNNVLEKKSIKNDTKAFVETFLIGIAKNIENVENTDSKILKQKYDELEKRAEFTKELLKSGIDKAANVNKRLNLSIFMFSK